MIRAERALPDREGPLVARARQLPLLAQRGGALDRHVVDHAREQQVRARAGVQHLVLPHGALAGAGHGGHRIAVDRDRLAVEDERLIRAVEHGQPEIKVLPEVPDSVLLVGIRPRIDDRGVAIEGKADLLRIGVSGLVASDYLHLHLGITEGAEWHVHGRVRTARDGAVDRRRPGSGQIGNLERLHSGVDRTRAVRTADDDGLGRVAVNLLAFEQRQGSAERGEGGRGPFHSHDHRVRDLAARTVEHLQLEVPAGPLGDRSGIELDFVVD